MQIEDIDYFGVVIGITFLLFVFLFVRKGSIENNSGIISLSMFIVFLAGLIIFDNRFEVDVIKNILGAIGISSFFMAWIFILNLTEKSIGNKISYIEIKEAIFLSKKNPGKRFLALFFYMAACISIFTLFIINIASQ